MKLRELKSGDKFKLYARGCEWTVFQRTEGLREIHPVLVAKNAKGTFRVYSDVHPKWNSTIVNL